jgi:hypothetical protein
VTKVVTREKYFVTLRKRDNHGKRLKSDRLVYKKNHLTKKFTLSDAKEENLN